MLRSPDPDVSAGALIALALALLILPLRWLLGVVIAAAFHECCHWAAIRLCGGKVTAFHLGSGGAVMAAENLSRGKELVCALAGPLGGLLLLLTVKWFPVLAICALLQSAYNLLPVYPLDGGRALRCAAALLFSPATAAGIAVWAERIVLVTISITAVYAAVWLRLGLLPLLLAAAVIVRKNTLQTVENKSTIELPFQKG